MLDWRHCVALKIQSLIAIQSSVNRFSRLGIGIAEFGIDAASTLSDEIALHRVEQVQIVEFDFAELEEVFTYCKTCKKIKSRLSMTMHFYLLLGR